MDVACSTLCFSKEPFERALRHIAELEFSKVDLGIVADGSHVTPGEVVADSAAVLQRIRQGPTLAFPAVTARLTSEGGALDVEVDAIAHLCKQLASPLLVLQAAKTGTPIDAEIDRLTRLSRLTSTHGVTLTIVTETGTLAEDPSVAATLCQRVPSLGLTLDPSHLLCGPNQGKSYDSLFPFVRHVHLRDSGRTPDMFQVKVGRGEIEYSRIVATLGRTSFKGCLAVDIEDQIPCEEMAVEAEVRKLGLLLESLI